MADFRFYDSDALLRFPNVSFKVPLSQVTLDKMQEKTEELLSIVSGGEKDSDKLFAAITEAIDGILGEDSARRILSEKLCPDMFDALEVYTFICIEFAGAWKERILRTTEPVA